MKWFIVLIAFFLITKGKSANVNPADDLSAVILFDGYRRIVTFLSENFWCDLPADYYPPIQYPTSELLAVQKDGKIIVCHYNICYMNKNLSDGGPWQQIASRALSSSTSSYAVVGSTLIASGVGDLDDTLFEFLDLTNDDAEWVTADIKIPNIPEEPMLENSCMVAVNDSSFILIGGNVFSDDYQKVGGLTQIYNLETGEWSRMPDLNPRRHSHACIRYLDGVLLTGGVENTDCCAGTVRRDVDFFNLTSSSWQKFSPLNDARNSHVLVLVNEVPTVIGGRFTDYSEQFLDGGWQPWVEYSNPDPTSAVQVATNEFHC